MRYLSLLLTASIIAAPIALGQSILTVAGGGTDDGRPATAVGLSEPRGMTFDQNGNLLITERDNNKVRRVDLTTGIISTVAGNSGSGLSGDGRAANLATLNGPVGIAVDDDGNIYVVDNDNGRVRRVDASSGIISTVAGKSAIGGPVGDGGPATEALLRSPWDVALFDNKLYISEIGFDANRIREVDLSTGIINTIAGIHEEGFSGDGGPATAARFAEPRAIAFDDFGVLYVADSVNGRVRRIDPAGNVSTYAGGGSDPGDGVQAGDADLGFVIGLSFDSADNLYVTSHERLVKIDRSSTTLTIITTDLITAYGLEIAPDDNIYFADTDRDDVQRITPDGTRTVIAGGGQFVADGRPAISSIVIQPRGLAVHSDGSLYIADREHFRIRRVDPSGTISTVAGSDCCYVDDQEGEPATEARVGFPDDVAISPDEAFFLVADPLNGRVWRVQNGLISTFAGGGSPADDIGDGGLATQANVDPRGVSFDSSGNVYIADYDNHRVRRVDASTNIITTVAGSGPADGPGGYTGDGGSAAAALLNQPVKAVMDSSGNLFISDSRNRVIRKVAPNGEISTYAGISSGGEDLIDNVPATTTFMDPGDIALDSDGNLYIMDAAFHRVRMVSVSTGIISTVAGSATWYLEPGFSGDGGPAIDSELNIIFEFGGIAIGGDGDVFISDTLNNRVRAVFACRQVGDASILIPVDGATNVPTSPLLSWSGHPDGFRYDVVLGREFNPTTVIANDLASTTFTPTNLEPSTQYFWAVVAKGDPYCNPVSQFRTPIRSFTTTGECRAPQVPSLTAPTNGATGVGTTATLEWQSSSSATYDLYLGTMAPLPLVASDLTGTTFEATGLVSGSTYSWVVVARSTCDSTKTTTSAESFFSVSGTCDSAGTFTLASPSDGAADQPTEITLSWTPSANAGGYDLQLGTSNPPPLYRSGIGSTSFVASGLTPGMTYFWRVVATACNPIGSAISSVRSFTTRTCTTPGAPSIRFAPPGNVALGSSYVITWSASSDLDADGAYLVERARDSAFSTHYDGQLTQNTSATFVADRQGTFHHRVRAIAACAPDTPSAASTSVALTVVEGEPNVIFAVPPVGVVSELGAPLEEVRSRFTIENIGSAPISVLVSRGEIDSVPFFSIVDPAGGDFFINLEPGKPKELEVRFSGPPNDTAGGYQGFVVLNSIGEPLSILPYAFVSLKVGGSAATPPTFSVAGTDVEFVSFPAFDGDDSSRTPLTVDITNVSSEPIDLAAEIGPDLWLFPEANWNATPIPAGGTRSVKLFTRRNRAPRGSEFPRYTYFTVRTRDGASARLLVQDVDDKGLSSGRLAPEANERSFVVPEVRKSSGSNGTTLTTVLRLTNSGDQPVQVELILTPSGTDGFAANVRRSTVVVPPNDVAVITDPLGQLFADSGATVGQMEVRTAPELAGLLSVAASVSPEGSSNSRGGYEVPIFFRGEGAAQGETLTILGTSTIPSRVTRLVFAETSGIENVSVRVTAHDSTGVERGSVLVAVPRFGFTEIADLVASIPGATGVSGAQIEITVETGGGRLASFATVGERNSTAAGTLVARERGSLNGNTIASTLRRVRATATTPTSLAIPAIVNGPIVGGSNHNYQTLLGLTAPKASSATFALTYVPAGPSLAGQSKLIEVPANRTLEFANVLEDVFELGASSSGSVFVSAPALTEVHAYLLQDLNGQTRITGSLPLISPGSFLVTSGGLSSHVPLLLEGIDQSTSDTRGNSWSLLLSEIAGRRGLVVVRLYESTNRSRPIAEKEFAVGARQQLRIEDLFSEMGLDNDERRKDRANILCSVTGIGGSGLVSAVAVSVNNKDGTARTHVLQPGGGIPASGTSLALPIGPGSPDRSRPIRR